MDFIKLGYALHGTLVINKNVNLCITNVYSLMNVTYSHTVRLVKIYNDLGFINVINNKKNNNKSIITLTVKGVEFVNHCYQIINSLLKLKDLWFKEGMNIKMKLDCPKKFRDTTQGSYNVRLKSGEVVPVSEAVNTGSGYFKKKRKKKGDFSRMRPRTRENLELIKKLISKNSNISEVRSEFLRITCYMSKTSFNYYLKILESSV